MRTTRIDAINEALTLVGLNTVASLDDPVRQDVISAEETLDQLLKQVATHNSYYNRYAKVEFTADSEGYIYVPADVYDIESIEDPLVQVVIKGDKLWNLTDNTFVWTAGGKYTFSVTYFLDFTDLPEQVMRYVITATARRLYLKLFGVTSQLQALAVEEKIAYDAWQRWEYDSMDANMLAHPDSQRVWLSPRRAGRNSRR